MKRGQVELYLLVLLAAGAAVFLFSGVLNQHPAYAPSGSGSQTVACDNGATVVSACTDGSLIPTKICTNGQWYLTGTTCGSSGNALPPQGTIIPPNSGNNYANPPSGQEVCVSQGKIWSVSTSQCVTLNQDCTTTLGNRGKFDANGFCQNVQLMPTPTPFNPFGNLFGGGTPTPSVSPEQACTNRGGIWYYGTCKSVGDACLTSLGNAGVFVSQGWCQATNLVNNGGMPAGSSCQLYVNANCAAPTTCKLGNNWLDGFRCL